jgi:hypothetical protein
MAMARDVSAHGLPDAFERPRTVLTVRRKAIVLLMLASMHATCAPARSVRSLAAMPAQLSGSPRVHTRDGRVWVFSSWRRDETSLIGNAAPVDQPSAVRSVRLHRDEIVLIEFPEPTAPGTLGASGVEAGRDQLTALAVTLSIVATFGLAVVIGVAARGFHGWSLFSLPPWSNCPSLLVRSGDQWLSIGYGFANASARRFASESEHRVPASAAVDGVELRVRNEHRDIDRVQRVVLRAVDAPLDAEVASLANGGYVAVRTPRPPVQCVVAGHGSNCDGLATVDRSEQDLGGDRRDLVARSTLEGTFAPLGSSRVAVLVDARNTTVLSWTRARMQSLHGSRAGEWLASLERDDLAATRWFEQTERAITYARVRVRSSGRAFRDAGSLPYIGADWARTVAFVVDVEDPTAPIEVQIEAARQGWRFDAVRVAAIAEESLPTHDYEPTLRSASGAAARTAGDATGAVLAPGDEMVLGFRAASARPQRAQALFIRARGYYHSPIERSTRPASTALIERALREPTTSLGALAAESEERP